MNTWFKNNFNSTKFRITTSIVTLLLLLLVGVVVAQTFRTNNLTTAPKDRLVEQVEKSPDFAIGIEQDADAPMKILEASVKEVSATEYENLTSERNNLERIISAPTVKMVNNSDKIITEVMLQIFDNSMQEGKGIYIREQKIRPGEMYVIRPENFVKREVITKTDGRENTTSYIQEAMKSKNFWLPFADKSQVKVRVSVIFADGTKWFDRSQREEANND